MFTGIKRFADDDLGECTISLRTEEGSHTERQRPRQRDRDRQTDRQTNRQTQTDLLTWVSEGMRMTERDRPTDREIR